MKRAADTLIMRLNPRWTRARTQMKAGMLMGLESPSNRAERLARMVQNLGPCAKDLSEVVDKIDAVSLKADLRDFAAEMAQRGAAATLALYGPVDAGAGRLRRSQQERRAA